ncbi:universal stress protein, partial [Comamonas sp.]|uniref:universal stress protein n=1 Tax=Comamonas sp. TaxID=34028 RepID=UPI003A8EF954
MYNRILIATDGTELSDKAVRAGIELAALSGASVVALKVVSHYPRSYMEGTDLQDIKEAKRIEEQWTEQAQVLLGGIPVQHQHRHAVDGLAGVFPVLRQTVVLEIVNAHVVELSADTDDLGIGHVG